MNTISQLERALRDETLANEELRNHVAILKDVIDKRLHKDGIVELLQSFKSIEQDYSTFGPNQGQDTVTSYIAMSEFKDKLDNAIVEKS